MKHALWVIFYICRKTVMSKDWAIMCNKWGYTNIYSDEKTTKFVTVLLKYFCLFKFI